MAVVADAATLECQRAIPDLAAMHVFEADIDCLPGHVETALRNAAGGSAQHRVGLWRSIGAEDLEDPVRISEAALYIVEQIEESWIHGDAAVGAEITQEVVQLMQGAALVVVADAIDQRDLFFGVEMVEGERTCLVFSLFGKNRCRGSAQSNTDEMSSVH